MLKQTNKNPTSDKPVSAQNIPTTYMKNKTNQRMDQGYE